MTWTFRVTGMGSVPVVAVAQSLPPGGAGDRGKRPGSPAPPGGNPTFRLKVYKLSLITFMCTNRHSPAGTGRDPPLPVRGHERLLRLRRAAGQAAPPRPAGGR